MQKLLQVLNDVLAEIDPKVNFFFLCDEKGGKKASFCH